jgi:hypothetical protein
MRITTRTTRPIVKGDLIVSDLLSCLQVVILIVIPFRRIIGSPYLFGFTSVIWGADGVVRDPPSKNNITKKLISIKKRGFQL